MAAKKRTAHKKPSKPAAQRAKKPAKTSATRASKRSARAGAHKASARQAGLTVDAYIAELRPDLRALCARVLSLVVDAAPDAHVSIKWGQPVWEKNGPFAWMRAAAGHVSFGFWRGAQLEDPLGLLEGDGDKMRHIKLMPEGAFDAKALARLVHQAVAHNVTRGDPTR